jgi:superfamily II RNA helicase
VKPVSFTHRLNECIAGMRTKDLLPALFFTFSRKNCERFAEKVSGSLLDSTETANVKHILAFHLHRYADTIQKLPQYHQLVALLERGIAFHHSGLLPLLKEGVELLFQRGLIRVLFCTESLAIGVNLPARSVVFTGLEKPTGGACGGFRSLRYDEYAQMAGRAGRRGKDTRGFVFYLPEREPLSAEELRGVMSGSLPALQSRIQFHYDFVLKALHLGANGAATATTDTEPLWSRLLGKSYWQTQRTVALRALTAEVEAARQVRDAQRARLTPAQWAAFEERADLQHKVRYLSNSKQKTAKLALRRWEEEHDGPAWRNAEKVWTTEQDLTRHYKSLRADLTAAESVRTEDRIQPILSALCEWGLVEGDVLTHRGVLATECNEANPLLMTELYASAILRNATQEEIVGTLATLITDKMPADFSAADFDYAHTDSAKLLEAAAVRGARIDLVRNIGSPEDFWTVSPYWSAVLTDWLAIEDTALAAGTIVKKYDLYEANLMRAVLKCANLVDEWLAMATFCGDVAMLDRMRGVHDRLLRGIARPESLYLRL